VQGTQGAVFQMLAHGISTGGLFLIVGMLSDRRHTRLISEFGGLKLVAPKLVAAFLLVTLASIAMPTLNGFVGEFLILIGAFGSRIANAQIYTAVAATGVILSAVYMLWMFMRVNYGELTNPKNQKMPDLSLREWIVIGPVCAMAIFMGVFPNVFLVPMAPAVERNVASVIGAPAVNAEATALEAAPVVIAAGDASPEAVPDTPPVDPAVAAEGESR